MLSSYSSIPNFEQQIAQIDTSRMTPAQLESTKNAVSKLCVGYAAAKEALGGVSGIFDLEKFAAAFAHSESVTDSHVWEAGIWNNLGTRDHCFAWIKCSTFSSSWSHCISRAVLENNMPYREAVAAAKSIKDQQSLSLKLADAKVDRRGVVHTTLAVDFGFTEVSTKRLTEATAKFLFVNDDLTWPTADPELRIGAIQSAFAFGWIAETQIGPTIELVKKYMDSCNPQKYPQITRFLMHTFDPSAVDIWLNRLKLMVASQVQLGNFDSIPPSRTSRLLVAPQMTQPLLGLLKGKQWFHSLGDVADYFLMNDSSFLVLFATLEQLIALREYYQAPQTLVIPLVMGTRMLPACNDTVIYILCVTRSEHICHQLSASLFPRSAQKQHMSISAESLLAAHFSKNTSMLLFPAWPESLWASLLGRRDSKQRGRHSVICIGSCGVSLPLFCNRTGHHFRQLISARDEEAPEVVSFRSHLVQCLDSYVCNSPLLALMHIFHLRFHMHDFGR